VILSEASKLRAEFGKPVYLSLSVDAPDDVLVEEGSIHMINTHTHTHTHTNTHECARVFVCVFVCVCVCVERERERARPREIERASESERERERLCFTHIHIYALRHLGPYIFFISHLLRHLGSAHPGTCPPAPALFRSDVCHIFHIYHR
jgi:hypothetical protein